MVDRLRSHGIKSEEVLSVMSEIPRHIFVDPVFANRAYDDDALPLGRGQSISKPFVVALMSELCFSIKPQKILEIGSGCGYQTAILSRMGKLVVSVERIKSLLDLCRKNLHMIGTNNVRLHHGDGHLGMSSSAPYDVVLVTAAAKTVPEPLFNQLNDGGRLIIPMESKDQSEQQLFIFDKGDDGVKISNFGISPFVPMLDGKIS